MICLCLQTTAQTGMWQDRNRTFLIPMLSGNDLIGHAQVDLLDKVSKDSNSYAVQVFDEYLHDVGEKKLMLGSQFIFLKAAFNGKDIVTKFYNEKKKQVRYISLSQKADIVFDTTITLDGWISDYEDHRNFISTSMHAIPKTGIIDYYQINSKGKNYGACTFIGNNNHVWQHQTDMEAISNFLYADQTTTLNTLFEYTSSKVGNDVNTHIQGISSQGGVSTFSLQLNTDQGISIYPIAATIKNNIIEVVSEFTKRTSRYGRIKWGVCLHHIDASGHLIDEVFNDLTETMREDSIFKKNKLLTFSYLFMHKAIPLKNGNWLVASEHIKRNFNAASHRGRRKDVYNKKSICLLEVNNKANIVNTFIEPNKEESVIIDYKYLHHPHNGSMSLLARDRLDISYFMQDEHRTDDCISFVYTDINGRARKISLGQIKYENGEVKVDKFNVPLLTAATRINILPSRFGHVLLFKYDPYYGVIDFDNIKFNK